MRACYNHLSSNQIQPDGSLKQRFKLIDEFQITKAKETLRNLLEEGLDNKYISQEEYNAMNLETKELARFYCYLKVHKEYEPKKAPPSMPIISGSGSITENTSLFVQHHIKDVSRTHPSYLEAGLQISSICSNHT